MATSCTYDQYADACRAGRGNWSWKGFFKVLITHLLFYFTGPVGIALLLAVRWETVCSLQNLSIAATIRAPIEWSQFVAVVATAVMQYQAPRVMTETSYLAFVLVVRSIVVSVKYAYFTDAIWQRWYRERDPFVLRLVLVLETWITIPANIIRWEMRASLAASMRKEDVSSCIDTMRIRMIKTPPWWEEPDTGAAAASSPLSPLMIDSAVAFAKDTAQDSTSVLFSDGLSLDEDAGVALGSVFLPNEVDEVEMVKVRPVELKMSRVAELVVSVASCSLADESGWVDARKWLRVYGGLPLSILLVACWPMIGRLCFHGLLDVHYEPNTVATVGLQVFIALVCTFLTTMQMLYLIAALHDLQRRYACWIGMLVMLGPAAFSDLSEDAGFGELLRENHMSGFQADLTDAETVAALHLVWRGLRHFGPWWSRRLHMFLSLTLVLLVGMTLSLVFVVWMTDHRELFLALPVFSTFLLAALWVLARSIKVGMDINTLGSVYMPLALQTARSNLYFTHFRMSRGAAQAGAASAAEPNANRRLSSSLAEADLALARMADHVAAMQAASPVCICGIPATPALMNAVRGMVVPLVGAVVKGYFE